MNFARKRFNALFACQAFGGLVALFVYASIVDSIIVGNLVGVDALAGVAAVLPLAAVLMFLCSHYLVLDRIRLSLATTVSFGFLLTTGCVAALCFVCGLDAMWIGFPLGALLTLVALAVYCRVLTRRYSLLLTERVKYVAVKYGKIFSAMNSELDFTRFLSGGFHQTLENIG